MPYTMEDYKLDSAKELVLEIAPEQLLSLLPLAEIEKYVKKQKAAKDKGAPRSRKRRPEK